MVRATSELGPLAGGLWLLLRAFAQRAYVFACFSGCASRNLGTIPESVTILTSTVEAVVGSALSSNHLQNLPLTHALPGSR